MGTFCREQKFSIRILIGENEFIWGEISYGREISLPGGGRTSIQEGIHRGKIFLREGLERERVFLFQGEWDLFRGYFFSRETFRPLLESCVYRDMQAK